MRIIVPALGSRGDIQPYINLCQGLKKAGHHPILASLPCMKPLVESHEVEFAAIGPDVDLGEMAARVWEQTSQFWWIGFLRVMQLGAQLVEQAYPDLFALCRSADLIVVNDTSAGAAEAEKLGIPWVSVTLQPLRAPKNRKPAAGIRGRLNDVLWFHLGRMLIAPINAFRKRVGAPLVEGIVSTGIMSDKLLLLPVSPQVVTADPEWPPHVKLTGFWFPELHPDWRPPDDLQRFVDSGEPPVVICLGAMSLSGENARRAAGIALRAVERSGVRAVIQGWDGILRGRAMPSGTIHAGPVPHGWLLERAAGIVHHGGAGTTASGFRSGKPALVIPHIIDQFYWSQRVEALGTGPVPIPRPKLTVEGLAAGMRQILDDREMQNRAGELGRKIRAEGNGVERAVHHIEAAKDRVC
ncbi:MAG: glycosyltransferase [Anaerolineales bacterium]